MNARKAFAVVVFIVLNGLFSVFASINFASKLHVSLSALPSVLADNGFGWLPFNFFYLLYRFHSDGPVLFRAGIVITFVGFLISLLVAFCIAFVKKKELTSAGTAAFASEEEIRKKGLLSPVDPVKDGVIVGCWDSGIPYEKRLKAAEKLAKITHRSKWKLLKLFPGKREYIVDNAPTHIIMAAPSRSGKGVGVVVPTFASWRGSIVCADPKRENLDITGAYRKYVMGHNVLEFAPADSRPTSRWNPLNEIRWGTPNEGRDVSNLTEILVGPGDGNQAYWIDNAKDLIVGVITHLKYRDMVINTKNDWHHGDPHFRETCMYDVYQFLAAGMKADENAGEEEPDEEEEANPNAPTGFRKTLKEELYGIEDREWNKLHSGEPPKYKKAPVEHFPADGVIFDIPNPLGTSRDAFLELKITREKARTVTHFTEEALRSPQLHPVVVTKFNSFISKSPNEAGGVLSTAITALMIFAEKTIIDNTITSDFYLRDIRNTPEPTDLYLVVPPSDLKRVGKLFRLLIEFIVIKSTESLHGDKHRCLLLVDEFPAFGKMDNLVRELGYTAGYGLKTLLIVQGLEQIKTIYKSMESLTNCQTQIFLGPNDDMTRKYVSEAFGKKTIMLKQKQAPQGFMDGFGKETYTYIEKDRALMLPDETSSKLSNHSAMLIEGLRIYSPKNKFFLMKDMLDRFDGARKKYDPRHRIGLRDEVK